MNNKKREIRRILMGQTIRQEDGSYVAAQSGRRMIFQGVQNGSSAVRFFGVGRKRRRYAVTNEASLAQVQEAFSHVGSKLSLKALPDAVCCLYRTALGSPALLTAELLEDTVEVSVYAGRTPLAPVRRRFLFSRVEKYLPDTFSAMDREEVRKVEQEEAEAEKEERKRLRKERKEKQAKKRKRK